MSDHGDYDSAVRASMILTVVLLLKFILTISIQGGKRAQSGNRPAEDQNLGIAPPGVQFGLSKPEREEEAQDQGNQTALLAKDQESRWNRIVANDLENIPLGLIVCWAAVLVQANSTTHVILISLFAIGRIGHTVSYAYALQPYRTIFWAAATLSSIGMGINGVLGAFGVH